MKYSDELINEVKELYPHSKEMLWHAVEGHQILGRYLNDSYTGTIPVDFILKASSLEELKAVAVKEKRKVELYRKWGNEYDIFRRTSAP